MVSRRLSSSRKGRVVRSSTLLGRLTFKVSYINLPFTVLDEMVAEMNLSYLVGYYLIGNLIMISICAFFLCGIKPIAVAGVKLFY